jgi:hypothetical protein
MALMVSLMTVDDDLRAFGRRVATLVNNGPMHLAQMLATATQVYPTRTDSIAGTATMLRCEFRMRHSGAPVTRQAAHDVLERLRCCQLLDAHYLDESGRSIGPVDLMLQAS